MIIAKTEKGFDIVSNPLRTGEYVVLYGQNGKRYVDRKSVVDYLLHMTEGNMKVGDVLGFNLPIEYSCDHRIECYRNGDCYACTGHYQHPANQRDYSENYQFYRNHTSEEFVAALQVGIDKVKGKPKFDLSAMLEDARAELEQLEPEVREWIEKSIMKQIARYGLGILFRWFTIGDIPDGRFLECMVELARRNPDVSFWSYTKKYHIVNSWLDRNGDLPDNLVIVFSHWMNKDGTYFPMDNRHNLPTSEFIPNGREDLLETVTWVCPCSDPNWIGTCETCEHRCGTLKKGQSMALKEHSTAGTRKRDAEIRAKRKAMMEDMQNAVDILSRLAKKAKMNVA